MGLGVEEAWGLTMVEFMKIAEVKEAAAKAARNEPEPITQDEVEAMAENLRARRIIDEKGLVRNG